jgi:hypothetical protein
MARRLLPAALAFAALLSDVRMSLVLALDCYGDQLERRCGATRTVLAATSLFLLVLSAALRSPAVVGGVPRIAVSALVLTLFLYATIAFGALLPARRATVASMQREETQVSRRRAA